MIIAFFSIFLGTCLIGFVVLPYCITFLRTRQIGQFVREEGPQGHLKKAGTPTMGGIVFIGITSIIFGLYLVFQGSNISQWLPLYGLLAYSVIGFLDDYIKTVQKSPYGLKARQDILLQILFSVPFLLWVYFYGNHPVHLVLWIVFEVIFVLAVVNSVNLTDGVDGLLTSVSLPIFGFYAIVFVSLNQIVPFVFSIVMFSSLLSFLFFNAYPARVFMGNIGSFAIGGSLVVLAILSNTELLLLILGLIFVVEALSVIIQVTWFKITKKKYGEGKRVFKMSPIHHHLELSGYSETQIVTLFVIIQVLLCVVAGVIYFL